jgi:thiamine transport system ATP-binding protein
MSSAVAPEPGVPPALVIEQVVVELGGRRILDRVGLVVGPGELVALTGASGSGKSTLLRAVAGLVPLTGGRILLRGADLAGVPTHRRGIGMVFQDQALFPHLDVAGNIAYGLRMARTPRRTRSARVDALLGLVGLDPERVRHQAVSTLSGGEAQRVALARALAPGPAVLLLDEPLSALDPDAHARLAADLRHVLQTTATTTLHVTHDRAEAAAVCDRVVDLAALGPGPSA